MACPSLGPGLGPGPVGWSGRWGWAAAGRPGRARRAGGRASSSVGGPEMCTRPRSSTQPRSAVSSARRAFCSTRSTAVPASRIRTTCSKTVPVALGSRPIDGSSSSTTCGLTISERANSTCFCCPPDSAPASADHRSATTGNRVFTKSMRSLTSARSLSGEGAEPDVLLDRHLPEDAVALEHVGEARGQHLLGVVAGDVRAGDPDRAGARGEHAAGDLEHGGLAGAVGTDQADHGGGRHLDGEAAQDEGGAAVAGLDVLELEEVLGRGCRFRRQGRPPGLGGRSARPTAVPSQIGRPRSKTTTWSERLMTRSMLCSTTMKVLPSALSERTRLAIRSMSAGFTPPAGSSSMIVSGSAISTPASSSSFCWP